MNNADRCFSRASLGVKPPKLIVVTTHLNNIPDLKITIDSLKQQTYTNWEHVIVDAGTPNIASELAGFLSPKVKLEIVKGCSIYEGMDIGRFIKRSLYFQILNSGTVYVNQCSLACAMSQVEQYGVHCFSALLRTCGGKMSRVTASASKFPWEIFHEACIFPSSSIRHKELYGLAADVRFILDNSLQFKVFFSRTELIVYTKGGESDRQGSTSFRSFSYLRLIKDCVALGKWRAACFYFIRFVKDGILAIGRALNI